MVSLLQPVPSKCLLSRSRSASTSPLSEFINTLLLMSLLMRVSGEMGLHNPSLLLLPQAISNAFACKSHLPPPLIQGGICEMSRREENLSDCNKCSQGASEGGEGRGMGLKTGTRVSRPQDWDLWQIPGPCLGCNLSS